MPRVTIKQLQDRLTYNEQRELIALREKDKKIKELEAKLAYDLRKDQIPMLQAMSQALEAMSKALLSVNRDF